MAPPPGSRVYVLSPFLLPVCMTNIDSEAPRTPCRPSFSRPPSPSRSRSALITIPLRHLVPQGAQTRSFAPRQDLDHAVKYHM
eukprot:1515141-Heterocapsa_arctica.AAC.1